MASDRPTASTAALLDLPFSRELADEATPSELIRLIASYSPDHILIQDRALRYLLVINPQLGITPEEMLGRTDHDILPAAEADKLTAYKQEVIATGKSRTLELSVQSKSGTTEHFAGSYVPWFDATGSVQGLLGYFRNVTDRKAAEEALQIALHDLRESQRIARIGTYRFRPPTKDWSSTPTLDEILGISAEFEKRDFTSWEALLHPDDRQAVLDYFSQDVIAQQRDFDLEYRIVRPIDGQEIWVHGLGKIEYSPDGQVLSMLGTIQDITEQKRITEALRAANERLVDSDRRKDQFLAMLSHELRNPLAPIRTSLDLLQRTSAHTPTAQRALSVIGRQVQHLTRLVDDLLDITRIARGKITLERESIELAAFVRAVIADHLPRFDERQVDLQVEVRSNPVWIQGDRTRLAQIVGNLLTNAAKFTAAGGQTRVVVCANPQNAAAYIHVQDTGRGIEPEFLSQVFEPFCQGKPTADQKQGGLGLGLSVVQGLVELHGGSVEVASAGAGRGTTFTVSLPLASKAPETTAANHGLARTGEKTRVLVVEDHVDAAEMMQEVLEAIGYEAEIALTGPAGLARARESVPDVMICDIGLPGLDGYEVARQIRAQQELAHIRLIALSGYAGPEDLARSAAAGFDVHLAKPASLEELEHAIASSP